jgi:hypothetical protein
MYGDHLPARIAPDILFHAIPKKVQRSSKIKIRMNYTKK